MMKEIKQYLNLNRNIFVNFIILIIVYYIISYILALKDADGLAKLIHAIFIISIGHGILTYLSYKRGYDYISEKCAEGNYVSLLYIISIPLVVSFFFANIYRLIVIVNDGYFLTYGEFAMMNLLSFPLIFISIIIVILNTTKGYTYIRIFIACIIYIFVYVVLLYIAELIDEQIQVSVFSPSLSIAYWIFLPLGYIVYFFRNLKKVS